MKSVLPKLFFGFSGISVCLAIIRLATNLSFAPTAPVAELNPTIAFEAVPAMEMMVPPPPPIALATWNLNNTNVPTTEAAGIDAANATFGSGVDDNIDYGDGCDGSSNGAYRTEDWTTSNSLSSTDYIEFCITATDPADIIEITSISFQYRSTSNSGDDGPTNMEVFYATSSTGFSDATQLGSDLSFSGNMGSCSTFNEALATPVTTYRFCFRAYGYDSEGSDGRLRFDNVVINGNIYPCTDNLAYWNLNESRSATTVATDVTASLATFGSGVQETSDAYPSDDVTNNGAYRGDNWTTAGTRNDDDYIEFCVSSTEKLTINQFSFMERRQENDEGPRVLEVRYSTEAAFANPTSLGTVNLPANDDWRTQLFTGLNIMATNATICFRIYGYDADSDGGDEAWRFDDVRICGNVMGWK